MTTTREDEDALLRAFMLAYRIVCDLHDVKGEPVNFNETTTFQRLQEIATSQTIIPDSAKDLRHPLHDPAVVGSHFEETRTDVVADDQKIALAVMRALEWRA